METRLIANCFPLLRNFTFIAKQILLVERRKLFKIYSCMYSFTFTKTVSFTKFKSLQRVKIGFQSSH